MRAILIAAVLAAGPAHADRIAREGDSSVRLTEAPCPAEVLKHIPEGSRGFWRLAHSIIGGRGYVACWAELRGVAYLQYADGDQGALSLTLFKDSPGV